MKTEPTESKAESEEISQSNVDEQEPKKNEEVIVIETKFDRFADSYINLREKNKIFKFCFHILSIATFITVGFNTPLQIELYPYLDMCCMAIYFLNFLLFLFDAIMKIKANGFSSDENSFIQNTWNIIQFIMCMFLLSAAIFQVFEILGFIFPLYIITSFSRIPLSLILILLIPDYVDVDLGGVFSAESLNQLGKVLFFSVYFFLIFTLMGIQFIGPINGVCLRKNTDDTNFNSSSFTIPFHHCNLYPGGIGYKCPPGFECLSQYAFGIDDGNLYFQDIFKGFMFVYEGSIQDGWSSQFLYSIETNDILVSTIFFLGLILFSAWLVRNVFVAVICQVAGDALEYDPPEKVYDLRSANFGLRFNIDQDQVLLKDVAQNKKPEGIFTIFLKYILKSIYWNALITMLLIADMIILALLGMIIYWQTAIGIFFLIDPFLKLFAFGKNYYPIKEWILPEFLFPIVNMAAVILNIYGYYQLDFIYAIRLIKIISVHDFIYGYIYRILGNYIRFGAALMLTIIVLFILTCLSMQIFIGVPTLLDPTVSILDSYPPSFLDIFIIFLQGGAFSTILSLSGVVSQPLFYFVFLFFIGIHFFSNTIMMSVFITFILANLELTEEEKVEMQKKTEIKFEPLDEYAGTNIETGVIRLDDKITDNSVIPLRFKIYTKFKNAPLTAPIPDSLKNSNVPNINLRFMEAYLSNNYPIYDERLYISDVISLDKDSYYKYFMTKNFGFNDEDLKPPTFSMDYQTMADMLSILKTNTSPLHAPLPETKNKTLASTTNRLPQAEYSDTNKNEENPIMALQKKMVIFVEKRKRIIYKLREQHPNIDRSLFIFERKNYIRRACGFILNSRYINKNDSFPLGGILESQTYFEWLMILITIASTVLMMLETANNMVFDQFYTKIFEYVFVGISVLELILRLVAQGLIFSPSAIFNEPSAFLNIILLILSIVHTFYFYQVSQTNKFIYLSSYTTFAVFLRLTRCFRPFRIVLISKDLFRVIVLLVSAWKNIAKVLCLLLILLSFFAYFGYLSFKGRFDRCNDDQIPDLVDCVGYYDAPLPSPPVSITDTNFVSLNTTVRVPRISVGERGVSFDTFGIAYLSSYILMTLDGWTSALDYAKTLVGDWVTLYFYAYVFFANLIGVSMFVGVVCNGYSINTGDALLTKDQKHWSDLTQRIDLTYPIFVPQRPLNPILAVLYDIIVSFPYRIFHTLIICVSPTALLVYPLNTPLYIPQQYICYLIIFACHLYFFLDIFIKIIAFGFLTFFMGTINVIDTLLYILTITVVCLEIFTTYRSNQILFYVLVCAITVELILLSTRWEVLRNLMLTFITSVIKSLSTITVMFIIMVVYALFGNVLFGRVKYGVTLNGYFNYRTSFNALFILFIFATGDNWSAYMFDNAITEPMCTYDSQYPVMTDCGSLVASVIYSITYLLIIQQMILNLFIANVLSNFAVFCASDEVAGRFKPSDIPSYLMLWNKYDKNQKSKISRNYARMLCLEYFNLKNYTIVADVFILAQLREEIDRAIKTSYLNEDEDRIDNDDYKEHGSISFRDLMVILATRLTEIKPSFKTAELLDRINMEEEIAENVSSSLIWKWYKYVKSYQKADNQNQDITDKTVRIATEKTSDDQDDEGAPKVFSSMKFDPDSLKKELDKIIEETENADTESIEAICNLWYEEYSAAIASANKIT